MSRTFRAWLSLLLLVSCCSPGYKDISNDAEYAQVVGKTFITLDDLVIVGFTNDDAKRTIDGYSLTERPGISGREVVTRGVLPTGSAIRVERIRNCIYCLSFGRNVVVKITSTDQYDGVDVNLIDRGNIFVSRSNGAPVEMNPRLFEPEMK